MLVQPEFSFEIEPLFWTLAFLTLGAGYLYRSRKPGLLAATLAGSFIGGKLAYVFLKGGSFSILGYDSIGFPIGGAIAFLVYSHIKRPNMKHMAREADTIALFCGLFIFIIRIGCFLDGHLLGKITDLPWCVAKFGHCVHPVGLYYSLSGLAIFIFLWNKKKRFHGEISILFLALFALYRFVFDFFRLFPDQMWGPLSNRQWITLIIMIAGITILIREYQVHRVIHKNSDTGG
ncbi:MAG: prolipoprotein diacylglyceryl transferase [Nanobdellota archaeon]